MIDRVWKACAAALILAVSVLIFFVFTGKI